MARPRLPRGFGSAGAVLSFGDYARQSYFPALDGVRGLSILLVLLHHVPAVAPGPWLAFQENGRLGVSFFFVVSGFLICTLLLRERDTYGRIDWPKFYGRRALRLLPLYYVALFVQAVLVYGLHQYSPENRALFQAKLPAYLFYYNNWLANATVGPFFCSWSLAVEEQFYLGFGLLLWIAPWRKAAVSLIALLLMKIAAYQCFGILDQQSAVWRVLFSYQEPILWGVLLGFALHHRPVYDRLAWLGRGWVVATVGSALAGVIVLHQVIVQTGWDAEALYATVTLLVAGIVVRARTPGLSHPALQLVGRISYGIYLLHMFVIAGVKKLPHGMDPAVCFALSTPLAIGVAWAVYVGFERPIIRYYKQRLSASPARPAVVVSRPTVATSPLEPV